MSQQAESAEGLANFIAAEHTITHKNRIASLPRMGFGTRAKTLIHDEHERHTTHAKATSAPWPLLTRGEYYTAAPLYGIVEQGTHGPRGDVYSSDPALRTPMHLRSPKREP